jgi:hypothetical protein
MARSLLSTAQAQLIARNVRLLFLFPLEFADGTLYLHTALGDITWSGHTWHGAGPLLSMGQMSEGSDVQAEGITLTLSGIDPTMLAECRDQAKTGGWAQLFLAFLDDSGAIVPDPIPLYGGLIDEPKFSIDVPTSTVTIVIENRLSDLKRSRGGRYTDQDQRQRDPTDISLKWVSYLQDQHFEWK